MKFTLSHARDNQGHQIKVTVTAEAGETIASVRTEMDNFQLGTDALNPHEVQYTRTFGNAGGGFTPGSNHTVKVTATASAANIQVASERWND